MSSGRSTVYRVDLAERSLLDLEAIYISIDADRSESAYAWYNGLERMIFSLDRNPERGVRTAEDRTLRQPLYRNKPHFYRLIYMIYKPAMRVIVIHIRHGARDKFEQSTPATE